MSDPRDTPLASGQNAARASRSKLTQYELVLDTGDDPKAIKLAERMNAYQPTLLELAKGADMPDMEVTVILADDFRQAVDEHLRAEADRKGEHHQDYTVERIGGVAVAKNLPTSDDYSTVTIILSAPALDFEEPFAGVVSTFMILHELIHTIQSRVRWASGALNSVIFPSQTARELTRSMTRVASDEFRADVIAHLLIKQTLTFEMNGEKIPHNKYYPRWNVEALTNEMGEAVYPGWLDIVQEYRNWRMPLLDMWRAIVTITDQTLTAAAHAEAERSIFELRDSIFRGADPTARDLYLNPMWRPIRSQLISQPLLPTVSELPEVEEKLLQAGERSIMKMWAKLGVFPEERPDRGLYLEVGEPVLPS